MSVTRFDEVVFMDNFLRSADNGLSSFPANRQFLFRSFGAPAGRLGIRCEEIHARSEGGSLDVGAMMDTLALARDAGGWAMSCVAELSPLSDAGLLPRLAPRQLVIGWGMPPSLMHWIDRQGASFIDVEISPIRFGSHLAFCARTNDRQIEAVLAGWRIDEEASWSEATVMRGYFSRRGSSLLFERGLRVGLFCGQTAVDLALVRDGRIARPLDALDEIAALARSVDLLVIKPHPYEADLRHLGELAAQLPNAAWTDANIYALLCADNLEFACGLSSGALHEASYFMKPAVHLIAPDRNNRSRLPASCSDWMTVGPGIASLDALAAIVEGTPRPAPPGPRFPVDALDRAFGLRWGLDARSPGLPMPAALEPGAVHDMRTPGPAREWLSFGWRNAERAGPPTTQDCACIVIPLDAQAAAGAAFVHVHIEGLLAIRSATQRPLVRGWINGQQAQLQAMPGTGARSKVRLDLPIRLSGAEPPRVLVLQFDLAGGGGRAVFELQRLTVQPGAGARSPATMLSTLSAGSAIAVMAAAACFGAFGSTSQPRTASELVPQPADLSGWREIGKTLATRMEWVRDDLQQLLLQQHHG